MKLYLNSYFYDPDHPYGIIIMEITQEKIEKYPLLNSMYNELISSGEEKINNHSFNCEDNELAKEIILLSKENPPPNSSALSAYSAIHCVLTSEYAGFRSETSSPSIRISIK